ncbi:hypothetical protein ACFW2X_06605 [Streptomyces antibioticus]|uniref:hypothetical protein n=1 Tax=Streptomyces antibioticus TaxID=1890 RepID=UPI003676CE64
MSTTQNPRHRNQEPEPVRPWVARLFHRRSTSVATAQAGRMAAEGLATGIREGERILRLTQDLTTALAETARWKRHAESFAQDAEDREKQLDHTYRERAQLLAWIAALHPATAVITASPDVDEDGWQLLYVVAGGWQMSWHIHPRDRDLFRHVTVVDVTDRRAQWDGHGTVQKYERIRNHVRLLALDTVADGPPTDVTGEARSA